MRDNIIVMGMKHSGKSTHGRLLAAKFRKPFIDTDDAIENLYAEDRKTRLSCRDIYRTEGRVFFRGLEHEALCQVEERLSDGERAVIALGGGLVANPELDAVLSGIGGVIVYLRVPYGILYERIVSNGLPPFLDSPNPRERFLEVCKEREPYYCKYEHLTIELGDLPVPEANNKIEDGVIEYWDGQ